ncbi:Zinc finger BED domain-containing protein RICESLEEPER 3, partial [Bienertia sinuspersici]
MRRNTHRITMHKHPFTTVFEFAKKKLKSLFKKVDRISLTTDLWWSKPKKIEYMALTAHFVDMEWKLEKRVLIVVHLPPPHKGVNIADSILRCLHEWKIGTKLLCNGKFHVRCCAHILNIIVQHGLEQVKHITDKVDDTVDYLNSSEVRLKRFGELVSQYNLKERKLALLSRLVGTQYDMLDCAIKFTK